MDWIKVLNRHVLLEYSDLRDSEFVAWIKIMALTAQLEHEPTHEQILVHIHHKTLTSLQDKLKKHSTTLQDVLKKVLIDVQHVVMRRTALKENTQRYRDKQRPVINDDMITSSSTSITKDKSRGREEYIKANAREDTPVDNSPPPPTKEALLDPEPKQTKEPEKEPDALLIELKETMDEISVVMPDLKMQRQVLLFVEGNVRGKNHAAMMHCLKSLLKQIQNGIEIEAPKQYLEAALKIEDGKHNAREHEKRAQEFKEPIRGEGLTAIGRVMRGIGARASP